MTPKISTKNIKTEIEALRIDRMINAETDRKIKAVKNVDQFGITTACFIDGEFVLVSSFPVPEDFAIAIKAA